MTDHAISGTQWRAARAGRGLKQDELAERAKVSRGTIAALEGDSREVLDNNRLAVVEAFRQLGVTFETDDDGERVVFAPLPSLPLPGHSFTQAEVHPDIMPI